MPKLEMVLNFERANKHLDILQQRLPDVRVLARSSFFIIAGCHVPAMPNEQEKAWLSAMKDAHVIQLWRCKEREDR